MDNDRYIINLSYKVTNQIPRLGKAQVYFIEGTLDNGDTILLPYSCNPLFGKTNVDEKIFFKSCSEGRKNN